MNYTIADQIAELKARIVNQEIEIDCMNPQKEGGRYQVAQMELEVLKRELEELKIEWKELEEKHNKPNCCEEHGESFQLDAELMELIEEMFKMGADFIHGEMDNLGKMVPLAGKIYTHPGWNEDLCTELEKRGFSKHIAVISFLGNGWNAWSEKVLDNAKSSKNNKQ